MSIPSSQPAMPAGAHAHGPLGVGDLHPGLPGNDGPGKSAPKVSPGYPAGGGGKKP
jgi:hypothetical protein